MKLCDAWSRNSALRELCRLSAAAYPSRQEVVLTEFCEMKFCHLFMTICHEGYLPIHYHSIMVFNIKVFSPLIFFRMKFQNFEVSSLHYCMDNRPTISRPVCTWKGRSHPDPREREGDTRASPADKGKGANMVQRSSTSRPAA